MPAGSTSASGGAGYIKVEKSGGGEGGERLRDLGMARKSRIIPKAKVLNNDQSASVWEKPPGRVPV